jgi:hypothetical protein
MDSVSGILAYITMNPERVLSGKAQSLLAKSEEEQVTLAQDIAKALKADIVKLKCGDYMVIRIKG